jgi:hypothetical protein
MNSLGPVNLLLNLALILTLLALFSRLSRTAIAACSGASWVLFGRKGFVALCLYLALLYGVTYFGLRRNGLPSAAVQLLTLGFYALVIMRLIACPKDEPQAEAPRVDPAELRRLLIAFFALLGISLILSLAAVRQLVYAAVFVNFILWTPLGFALTLLAFWPARRSPKPGPS